MTPKTITITLTATSDSHYDITVAGGVTTATFSTDDGIAGVKGRLTSICDNLGQYLPADALVEDPPTE